MIRVGDVLARLGHLLNDPTLTTWTDEELVAWVNDGAAAIVDRRPAARTVIRAHVLAEGSLQRLPAGGLMLIDMPRNLGMDGKTPGRVIRIADRQMLDDDDPDWHAQPPASLVRHYTFDERAPTAFYVYPPARAGVQVELVFSETPPAVSKPDEQIDLAPVFLPVLVDYVAYRALSKDDAEANAAAAVARYQAFVDAVGGQGSVVQAASPNVGSV